MKELLYGCQNSFNELYGRYKNKLFYYFYRMLGNCENTANDFLQDIFMKIIEKPEMYNPDYPFHKWIYSVAHNMCRNEYRKREVRKNSQFLNRPEEIIEQDFHSFEYIDPLDLAFSKIESLPEISKNVLLLKYRENFSIGEISDILEIPAGTVKSRLFNARAELGELLKKHEISF
jgi:RNA polymerase sigma-70 factor (ECF subfamily)